MNRLKLLLPMMFPMTISERPSAEATEFTTSSGAEVPNATIVNPITKSDTLFFFANDEAPSTSQINSITYSRGCFEKI